MTNEEDAVIDCPAEYQNNGHTYIRLKGQSDTIRHSYYSNIRQYTIYYRDSQDTINADTEITYVVVDGGEITVDNLQSGTGNNRGSCTKSRNNECSNW